MSETNNVDINQINRAVIDEFRANGGRVSGRFANTDLLLLTTRGAKTGATRVNPMMYVSDGERLIVFASKRGAPTNPDWYHNLVANPDVTVEVGNERFVARARVLQGEERERVWSMAAARHSFLNDHQAMTRRRIPVIALERVIAEPSG